MFSLSLILLTSRLRLCSVQEFTDTEAYGDIPMNLSSSRLHNKANIFLGHPNYASVHIRFNLERYSVVHSCCFTDYVTKEQYHWQETHASMITLLMSDISELVLKRAFGKCTLLPPPPLPIVVSGLQLIEVKCVTKQ